MLSQSVWERLTGQRDLLLSQGETISPAVVLYADIYNYEEWSRSLAAQGQAASLTKGFNRLIALLKAPVEKFEGIPLCVMGDSILALFLSRTSPSSSQQEEEMYRQLIDRALRSALEIIQALKEFPTLSGNGALKLSVGVDWGEVSLGLLEGTDGFIVLGECACTAHRLNSLARDNEVVITNLVDEADLQFVQELIAAYGFRMFAQKVEVKGKKGKVLRILEEGKEEPAGGAGDLWSQMSQMFPFNK